MKKEVKGFPGSLGGSGLLSLSLSETLSNVFVRCMCTGALKSASVNGARRVEAYRPAFRDKHQPPHICWLIRLTSRCTFLHLASSAI